MFISLVTKFRAPLPFNTLVTTMKATQHLPTVIRWSSSANHGNPSCTNSPHGGNNLNHQQQQQQQQQQTDQQCSTGGTGGATVGSNPNACANANTTASDQNGMCNTTQPYQMAKDRTACKDPQNLHDGALRPQTQPSRMPEFYNPSTDLTRLNNASQPQTTQQQRQFAASKTYRSLTMPLKSSRLANPFPEPVKQMPSCQVSDQEKAQRMYNDSRLPGGGRH